MISAEEIRKRRREGIEKHLEEKIIEFADEGYLGYSTSTHECPQWLRQKLEEHGYNVFLFGTDNKCVQILFGEEIRD